MTFHHSPNKSEHERQTDVIYPPTTSEPSINERCDTVVLMRNTILCRFGLAQGRIMIPFSDKRRSICVLQTCVITTQQNFSQQSEAVGPTRLGALVTFRFIIDRGKFALTVSLLPNHPIKNQRILVIGKLPSSDGIQVLATGVDAPVPERHRGEVGMSRAPLLFTG